MTNAQLVLGLALIGACRSDATDEEARETPVSGATDAVTADSGPTGDTAAPTKPEPDPNVPPVADAGADLEVSLGVEVVLDGKASFDVEDAALTYTWTQVAGPDVTDGASTLSGVTPSFVTEEVGTLRFSLVVSDGEDVSEPAEVRVQVLERVNAAIFVDGAAGDDKAGTGSPTAPFATLGRAVSALNDDRQDIYLARLPAGEGYDETATTADEPLRLPVGTSLYGGYDPADWARDVAQPSVIRLSSAGLALAPVEEDVWVSGVALEVAGSAGADEPVRGVVVFEGDARLTVADTRIVTGDVGPGREPLAASNVALQVSGVETVELLRNEIVAGSGGSGRDLDNPYTAKAARGAGHGGGGGGNAGTCYNCNGQRGDGGGGGNGGRPGCGGGNSTDGCIDAGGRAGGPGENGSAGAKGAGGDGGEGIVPMWLAPAEKLRNIVIRIRPENVTGAIDAIRNTWDRVIPQYPLEFSFVDERIDQLYRAEQRMVDILKYFAMLAIIISCLGLFGLASFMAEQRTKEIGIRKALGASVASIVVLMSTEFTKWVVIANLIAWPVAYLVMQGWLEKFAYRVEVGWLVYFMAGMGTILVALLTVSSQAVRSAVSNPADALRYE